MVSIKILAQPRSGSTFLLNVFRHIFGRNNIIIDHKLKRVNPPNVVVFRDLRDSVLSLARIHDKMKTKEKLPVPLDSIKTKQGIDKILAFSNVKYLLESSSACCAQSKRKNILILRYEDFNNNYAYLFETIEGFFKIKINQQKRKEIIQKTNVEHFKKIQQNLPDFSTFDKTTKIHGNHIHKGEIGGWKKMITNKSVQEYYTLKLNKQLSCLGYI